MTIYGAFSTAELMALLNRQTQHGITLFDTDIDEISNELDRRAAARARRYA